jgi:hypothetical protein
MKLGPKFVCNIMRSSHAVLDRLSGQPQKTVAIISLNSGLSHPQSMKSACNPNFFLPRFA